MSTPRWFATAFTCLAILWFAAPPLMEAYGPWAVVGTGVLAFFVVPPVIRWM